MRPSEPDVRAAEDRWTPRPFTAARGTGNPHLQTLLARALRPGAGPAYRRERVTTPDGDFLDLDWADDSMPSDGPSASGPPDPARPLVLVLHGLEGNAHRRYVRSACRELVARGIDAVAMNFRACSGEPNRTPRLYHSGETGDATFVLELLRRRHPGRRVGAMGFSLGGNVLLKLLGERPDGGTGLVEGAVAMSVPYDLAAGATLLEAGGWARLYVAYFLRSLRRKVRAKRELLGPVIDVDTALRARSLRAFDEVATAPLHGFRDAADYYAQSSSAGFLAGIRAPTLLLHAEDDPFLPPSAIPRAEMASNPGLTAAVTPRGGHVGFLAGTLRAPRFWGEEEAARFLAERLRRG